MKNSNEFLSSLKEMFGNIASVINERVDAIDKDIDENAKAIQTAYDNIKADRAEMAAITETIFDFANEVQGSANNGADTVRECDTFFSDCVSLVEDGFIEDEDFEDYDEDEEFDEEEDEQIAVDEVING